MIIYQQRNDLLTEADISETVTAIRADVVSEAIDSYIPPMSVEEQWDVPGLEKQLEAEFAVKLPLQSWLDNDDNLHKEALHEQILEKIESAYVSKNETVGTQMRNLKKQIILQILNTL